VSIGWVATTLSAMRRRAWLATSGAALLTTLLEREAAAQEEDAVVLVVNERNPTRTLEIAQIKKLFLGQTAFWHGVVPVKILVRPDQSKPAQAFYGPILGMTPQAFRKHWDELQLAGRGVAPKSCATAQELSAGIASNPGGLGFALTSEAWQMPGVKVLDITRPR
jgi:ABC-type phosphate transport system substrate-binding protein